jgi:predicted extracellular nuclease
MEGASTLDMSWRIPAALLQLWLAFDAGAQPPSELPIYAIQGAGHRSPFEGAEVQTTGVVTAVRGNGFFLQDPAGDGDDATSDAIFVFTGAAPAIRVGDALRVTGEVSEFTHGSVSEANLSTTEFAYPAILQLSGGNPLPAATILGAAGRAPPTETIDDDHLSRFEPDEDGIDFYESLEGMRVRVEGAVAVAPTSSFGEIFALADSGGGATGVSARGAIAVSPGDFNPERIQIDAPLPPRVDTGDRLGSVTGVVGYSFGSYEVLVTEPFEATRAGLAPEVTGLLPTPDRLTVSSYNVENLDPGDGWTRFLGIGSQIASGLNAPDIVALQEVQDQSGPADDGVTDASQTYRMLIDAIVSAGGPLYEFADVSPSDGQDGGQPGGNIRVGFLYNPSRVQVVAGSKRRLVDGDGEDAFESSRKPLSMRFRFNGIELTLVNCHLTSKLGSTPLFGSIQPPVDGNLGRRDAQAQFLNDYVDDLLALEPDANVIVLGDLNALSFESPLSILSGDPLDPVLFDLAPSLLPPSELYSFSFEGNAQLLDHLLVSSSLLDGAAPELDIVHLNAEFVDRFSDHDPLVGRFLLQIPEPSGLPLAAFGLLSVLLWRNARRCRHMRRGSSTGTIPEPKRIAGRGGRRDHLRHQSLRVRRRVRAGGPARDQPPDRRGLRALLAPVGGASPRGCGRPAAESAQSPGAARRRDRLPVGRGRPGGGARIPRPELPGDPLQHRLHEAQRGDGRGLDGDPLARGARADRGSRGEPARPGAAPR